MDLASEASLRKVYLLIACLALAGFLVYFALAGPRSAFGFLLGAACSFGNLWLFEWLTRAIVPGAGARKPWQAGAFAGRYLILFTIGYVIVKALGVNPLAVVLGLLVSTAAVLFSLTIELVQTLLRGRRTH